MRYLLSLSLLVALFSAPLHAAEGLSGTWMTTAAPSKTFIFKLKQDTFTGLVCGPCDDPATVFRIEDGKVVDAERVTFVIRDDEIVPSGSSRKPQIVTATLSGNQLTLRAQREKSADRSVTTVLKRVVENGVSVATKTWTLTGPSGSSRKEPSIEGKWVANGRLAQQNFVLKVRDNTVWGLVCGPCNADGVFLIDDGTIEGDRITFYINHIDTPPSPGRTGLNRNIMRGTILGNVMKFKWVREGAEDQPGGEMVLIGPVR